MLSDLGREEIISETFEIEKNVTLALKQTALFIWEENSFQTSFEFQHRHWRNLIADFDHMQVDWVTGLHFMSRN